MALNIEPSGSTPSYAPCRKPGITALSSPMGAWLSRREIREAREAKGQRLTDALWRRMRCVVC